MITRQWLLKRFAAFSFVFAIAFAVIGGLWVSAISHSYADLHISFYSSWFWGAGFYTAPICILLSLLSFVFVQWFIPRTHQTRLFAGLTSGFLFIVVALGMIAVVLYFTAINGAWEGFYISYNDRVYYLQITPGGGFMLGAIGFMVLASLIGAIIALLEALCSPDMRKDSIGKKDQNIPTYIPNHQSKDGNSSSAEQRLRTLKDLYDKGLLSQEEYLKKKKDIIDEL